MAENNIIDRYARDIKAELPNSKVFLFGSYAKGDDSDESDVDIAVFCDEFKTLGKRKATSKLFKLAYKYYEHDADIQPLAFTLDEMEANDFAREEIVMKGIELN